MNYLFAVFSFSDGFNHSGLIRQKGKEHLHGQCKRQGVSHEQSRTGAGGFVQSGNKCYSGEEHRVRSQGRVSNEDNLIEFDFTIKEAQRFNR